jgi:hypothetical protein
VKSTDERFLRSKEETVLQGMIDSLTEIEYATEWKEKRKSKI